MFKLFRLETSNELARAFTNFNLGRRMPINTAARLIANVLFSSRLAPLITQVIVGGVDDSGGHVFSVDPFVSLSEEKCVATVRVRLLPTTC
ncbi:MAG: hypothetical protein ACETVM_02545 [Candidatus Bathyarchaeia archaeon]